VTIKDLIRSSCKPNAVLGDVEQAEIGTAGWDIARSIHEASARSETSAVDADCFAHDGTDAPLAGGTRGRTRAALRLWKRMIGKGQANPEDGIRRGESFSERARIANELHDTLFQGFFGASMLLHQAVDQTSADYPSKPALSSALRMVNQTIDERREAIQGIHMASTAPSNLEHTFSKLLAEVAIGRGLRLRVLVLGKPWTLNPAIQEQLFLIGQEAAMNALRHSQATEIEVEIQYQRDLLRVFVRDNGCGINPEAVQKECDSHWGLRGMRERAEHISARFGIWSRTGAGTEVCVAIPIDLAKRQPMNAAATDWGRESAGSGPKSAATT
jgi:signal transduction histidine kinase